MPDGLRFIRQAPGFLQPSPVMDVTAARTDQRLGAAGRLADIFGSMHRLPTRSLPPFGIVNPHRRRDFAGAHAIVSFGSGHGAQYTMPTQAATGVSPASPGGSSRSGIHVEQHLAITVAAMLPEKREGAGNIDPAELGHHRFSIPVL